MPYKDPERRRQANRDAQRRYRRARITARHGLQMRVSEARIVLGIDRDLTARTITAALRKMTKTVHPDQNPGPDAARLMALANAAAETLRYWSKVARDAK